jgi:hypothetical protein
MTSINQFLGTFRLVNGVIWPFKKVQPRRYRLRILNGANGRFFRLKLQLDSGELTTKGLTVIGVDGGFLRQPAPTPTTTTADGPEEVLTLAPAERVDVLIEFGPYAGKSLVLVDDDFAGTVPVMRFDVASAAPAAPQPALAPPAWAVSPRAPAAPPADQPPAARMIGLYQATIGGMRMHSINGRTFQDTVEELPVLDTEEIWQFLNVTEEPHPMHLHLVNFTVLDRRPIKIIDPDPQYRDKFDGYAADSPVKFTKAVVNAGKFSDRIPFATDGMVKYWSIQKGLAPILEADQTRCTWLDHSKHEQVVVTTDHWLGGGGAERGDHVWDGVAMSRDQDDVSRLVREYVLNDLRWRGSQLELEAQLGGERRHRLLRAQRLRGVNRIDSRVSGHVGQCFGPFAAQGVERPIIGRVSTPGGESISV